MLNYSRAAYNKTVRDIKRMTYWANIITQIMAIVLPLYSMITGRGILALNIIMCILSGGYLAFYLLTYEMQERAAKVAKKNVKRTYKIIKHSAKTVNLIIAIYGIYTNTEKVSFISLTLSSITIVSWVLSMFFELGYIFIKKRLDFIIDGIELDFEGVINVGHNVGNFFRRLKGEEQKERKQHVSPKNRAILDELVRKEKEEKRRARREKYQNSWLGRIFMRHYEEYDGEYEEEYEYED